MLPRNKVHAVYQIISVPYAVVYLMLWYTFVNPFCGPQHPPNCKNGPNKSHKAQENALSITLLGILLDIIPYIVIKSFA